MGSKIGKIIEISDAERAAKLQDVDSTDQDSQIEKQAEQEYENEQVRDNEEEDEAERVVEVEFQDEYKINNADVTVTNEEKDTTQHDNDLPEYSQIDFQLVVLRETNEVKFEETPSLICFGRDAPQNWNEVDSSVKQIRSDLKRKAKHQESQILKLICPNCKMSSQERY